MSGRLLRARGVVFTCLVLCNRKSQCEIICDKERLGLDLLTCLISTCRHFLVCKYSRMWPLTNSAVMRRTHCTLVSTAGTTSSRATPPVIFFWISTKWHDFFEGFVHLNIFFRGALRRGFMMIVGEREWTVSTGEAQMCVCCTLSLEGVQVVSEGVCRFSLLQDAQVAEFLHLHFLRLPLPHRDHHLNTHKQSVFRCYRTLCESRKISPPVPHIQTETDRQTDVLLTLTFRVLTGSLSRETVSGKITSSVRTTGSSRGDWRGGKKSSWTKNSHWAAACIQTLSTRTVTW